MKKLNIYNKWLLSLCLPLGLMLSAETSSAADGIIRFRGAIVESPCTTSDSAGAAVACMRNGTTIEKPIAFNNKTATLPYNLGSVRTVNLSAQTRLMVISYD